MPTYVTPTYTAGFVGNICGATEWDAAMGDIEYLKANGDTILASSTTSATVVNTTSETEILSYSMPGGTLGATGALIISAVVAGVNSSGADRNAIWKLNYGGSVLATGTVAIYDAGMQFGEVRAMIRGNGSTTQQIGALFGSGASRPSTPSTYTAICPATTIGTVNVDSGVSQTVSVTVTLSVASANYKIEKLMHRIIKLT